MKDKKQNIIDYKISGLEARQKYRLAALKFKSEVLKKQKEAQAKKEREKKRLLGEVY